MVRLIKIIKGRKEKVMNGYILRRDTERLKGRSSGEING